MICKLNNIVMDSGWQAARALLVSLSDADAVDQLFPPEQHHRLVTHHVGEPQVGASGARSSHAHEGQARLEEEKPAGHGESARAHGPSYRYSVHRLAQQTR